MSGTQPLECGFEKARSYLISYHKCQCQTHNNDDAVTDLIVSHNMQLSKIAVLLFLLGLFLTARTQEVRVAAPIKDLKGDSVWVRGLVEDAFTHELLQDVSVKAMHPDGTVLCVVQTKDYAKIYSEAYGGMTIPFDDPMTYCSLDLPKAGDYELRVSRIDYEPQTVKLHVPRKEYGKRVKV